MFVLVPFWLFHPPGIISLYFSSSSQHSLIQIGRSWPPSDYSINQGFFLLHVVFNRVRMLLFDADFLKKLSSPRNHHFVLHGWCPLLHPEAASFSITIFYHSFVSWRLIFYPFHWNFDQSLNTALSYYVQESACLLLLSLHNCFFFMLMNIFNTICRFLWSCHL